MNSLFELFRSFRAGFTSRRAMLVTSALTMIMSLSAGDCWDFGGGVDAVQGDVYTAFTGESSYDGFVGDTAIVIVTVYNGKDVDADNPKGQKIGDAQFKWTSSNPGVIDLVADNFSTTSVAHFISKSQGTATLTATVDDSRLTPAPGVPTQVTIQARVGERPIAARLVPHGGTIRVGQSLPMHFELVTASGQPTYKGSKGGAVSFSCLEKSVADAPNGGQDNDSKCGNPAANLLDVRGITPGFARVALFWPSLNYTDTATVIVLPAIAPTRVTVSPASVALVAGATRQLSAKVFDQLDNEIAGATVQWLPNDVTVATVSIQGVLKGESTNGADSAKIQVIAKAADGVQASVGVTVYRAITNVAVSPNPFTMQVGFDHLFSYVFKAGNGSIVPSSATSATWSTGDPAIATVDQSGRVTARGIGTTTVRVTTGEGITGVSDLTVVPVPAAPVTSVVVSPSTASPLLSDSTFQFTAKAFDATGAEVAVPEGFRWLVDDSTIANINGSGLATLRKQGSTTVRAFYGNAANAPGGSSALTVR